MRRSRHYRLTYGDLISAHEEAGKFGPCRPGVHSDDALRGALGRPYCGYFRAIHQKAAVILHAIASSHGFSDGNKRTAVLVTDILIGESGYRLDGVGDEDLDAEIERLVLDLVERKRSLEEAMEWMRLRIRRRK